MNTVNRDFLRQVLSGEKFLLPHSEVKFLRSKRYNELSVKNLFTNLKKDKDFMLYFPEPTEKSRLPDREYFFNVLATLYPDYLADILAHAEKQRNSVPEGNGEVQGIVLSKYWQDRLASMPYRSAKNGKSIFLLK